MPLTDMPTNFNAVKSRKVKMRQEIEDFINCDCIYAEAWQDDSVCHQTNIDNYRTVVWRSKYKGQIEVHSHNKRVILEKRGKSNEN